MENLEKETKRSQKGLNMVAAMDFLFTPIPTNI